MTTSESPHFSSRQSSIVQRISCRRHPGVGIRTAALVLTEACNYQCIMCDYWKVKKPTFMPVKRAERFIRSVTGPDLQSVLLTGGEPLLHPQWREVAGFIPLGVRRNLCTNGSPLIRKNRDIGDYFDLLTISIDGARPETFHAIRGRNDLSDIWSALQSIKSDFPKIRIRLKMLILPDNFTEVVSLFRAALVSGFVEGVGYSLPHLSNVAFAFSKTGRDPSRAASRLMLGREDTIVFSGLVDRLYAEFAKEIEAGFLYEGDLRRFVRRLNSLHQSAEPPDVRHCCVPQHSIQLAPDGQVSRCFFLPPSGRIDEDEILIAETDFKSEANAVCRGCDQLLFANSYYESSGAREIVV